MDYDLFLVPRCEHAACQPAFRLRSGKLTIGRTPQSHLFLPDPSVSRMHAELNVTAHKITLTDLGSRNGTWVDNERIQCSVLQKRQEVRFGGTAFVLSGDPNRESAIDEDLATVVPGPSRLTPCPLDSLSPRQMEVLSWLVQGLNEKEVAVQLKISRETVHNHVRGIYAAYNVHSRVELLLKVNPMKWNKLTVFPSSE